MRKLLAVLVLVAGWHPPAADASLGLVPEGKYLGYYISWCTGFGNLFSATDPSKIYQNPDSAINACVGMVEGAGAGSCFTWGSVTLSAGSPGQPDTWLKNGSKYSGGVCGQGGVTAVQAQVKEYHFTGTDPWAPPPFTCAAWEGKQFFSVDVGASMCMAVDETHGCTASRESVGVRLGSQTDTYYAYTVQPGAGECGQPGAAVEPSDPNCVTWEGVTHCVDDETPAEFATAGDSWSPSDVPPNGCVSLADGSVVCAGGAATPPRPDTGTPGLPAQETANYYSGGNTYNWFNNQTVINSTGNPPGGIQDGTGEYGGGCDPSVGDLCGPFNWTEPEDSNPYDALTEGLSDARDLAFDPNNTPALPSGSIPTPGGSCPFSPVSIGNGGSLDLSPVCVWFELARPVFVWAVWLLTIWLLFGILFEANRGIP